METPGTPAYVAVINDGGSYANAQYTYVNVPTVTGVSPNQGTVILALGTSVTLTGTHFTPSSTVNFGTVAAASVTYESSTQITAVAPAYSVAGAADVTVANAGVTSSTTTADKFTYVPSVSQVAFNSDFTSGGNVADIVGNGFTSNTQVYFGTQAASQVNVISPTEVQATDPGNSTTGAVPVEVTAGGSTVAGGQYAYLALPAALAAPGALPSGSSTTQQLIWDIQMELHNLGWRANSSAAAYLDNPDTLLVSLVVAALNSGGVTAYNQLWSIANTSTVLTSALLKEGSSFGGGVGSTSTTDTNTSGGTAGGPNGCRAGTLYDTYQYTGPFNAKVVQLQISNSGWCWQNGNIIQNGWQAPQYWVASVVGLSPVCWENEWPGSGAAETGIDVSAAWSHAYAAGVWGFGAHYGSNHNFLCVNGAHFLDPSDDWQHVQLRVAAGGYWDDYDDWHGVPGSL